MTPEAQPIPAPRPAREPQPRGVLCPFCGEVSPDVRQCRGCRAFLDPLSRQASQNEMGPWSIRDPAQPFRPGCSYETILRLVERGKIGPMTVIRGPTTRQSWSFAGRTPSVANLFGSCHNCRKPTRPEDPACASCGASFAPETDRQRLGLAPVHLLPGQATPEAIASASLAEHEPARAPAPTRALTRSPSAPSAESHPAPPPHAREDLAALRARVARLKIVALLLLLAAGALLATLAGAIAGVLPWPAARSPVNRPGAQDAPKPPDQSTASASPASEPAPAEPGPADPGADEPEGAAPGAQPPPPTEPAPGDGPEDPRASGLSHAESLDAALAALDAESPEPERVRAAARAMQDTDSEPWLRAARQRVRLRPLRTLP